MICMFFLKMEHTQQNYSQNHFIEL